jgi:hypothetical protein
VPPFGRVSGIGVVKSGKVPRFDAQEKDEGCLCRSN